MRDTIDMAREAGFMLRAESVKGQSDWWECFDEEIEKLVALVRADAIADEREQGQKWFDAVTAQHKQEILAEREACAKVCDEQVERSLAAVEKTKRTTDHRIYRAAAQTATWNAAAIRARSCPPCNNDCDQGRNCPARKDK